MRLVQKLLYLVFKHFVENALFEDEFKDFKIPENIYLTSLIMILVKNLQQVTKIQL